MADLDAEERAQRAEQDERAHRADQLKERVYVSFTLLAVVLALRADSEHLSVGSAAGTLTLTVVATLLAVFLADLVAHLTVHGVLPTRPELREMVRVVSGALGVLVLPIVLMVLAWLSLLSLDAALRASSIALVVTLIGVGFLAARRLRVSPAQRLLVLLGEFVLGLVVVGLELLLHH